MDKDVYFLPQRPYCALGSLKDQLLYPSVEEINPEDYPKGHRLSKLHLLRRSYTDDALLQIFEQVDLSQLPSRFGDGDPYKGLHAVMDWSNILSLGEQQRLAFGRLLVNRPRFVILDEATSALDIRAEAKMYHLLQNLNSESSHTDKNGVTFISVGHRPTLLAYHDIKLNLNGGRNNTVTSIKSDDLSSVAFIN
jgi:putative ATP-binding cassette transporter